MEKTEQKLEVATEDSVDKNKKGVGIKI